MGVCVGTAGVCRPAAGKLAQRHSHLDSKSRLQPAPPTTRTYTQKYSCERSSLDFTLHHLYMTPKNHSNG